MSVFQHNILEEKFAHLSGEGKGFFFVTQVLALECGSMGTRVSTLATTYLFGFFREGTLRRGSHACN